MCGKNHFSSVRAGIVSFLLAVSAANGRVQAPTAFVLPESTKPVAVVLANGTANPHLPFISRQSLTSAETSAPMVFEVALKMRNFSELQARVSRGELISQQEMAEKYEPFPADYQTAVDWLKGEGFTIVRQDPHHMALFVSGKVSQIAQSLKVNFARVTMEGKEYTSAVTAPSVPANLSSLLVGINGLQPHLRAHKHLLKQQAQPNGTAGSAPYSPSQIAQAYSATGLYSTNVTGSGQTIAVVIDTFPATSDLQLFWSKCNVSQSINNISFIQVIQGNLPTPSGEESLDVEWCSSIAPACHVRVYATTDLVSSDLDQAYQQIYTDVTTHPQLGIHQMSMSYGQGETYTTQTQVNTDDQYFMELAAAGVTCFASSGDGGASPGNSSVSTDESGSTQVESPASDPYVTGVGGTTLLLDSNNNENSEVVWNDGSSGGATGGGTSTFFARPTWQTGIGVPALVSPQTKAMRLVPDVACSADPDFGAITYVNGAESTVGGTSWACPTWAGFCALINQARANAGLSSLGLLGPQIYPLLGTARYSSNIRDIVTGNNGTTNSGSTNGIHNYTARTGYDMATGIGVPLVQALSQTLVETSSQPQVPISVVFQDIAPGQNATITVTPTGSPVSYQWQRMAIGTTSWSNLSDNATYSGSATASLTITGSTLAMSGDQFQCAVTYNGPTILTSPSSSLVVETPLSISTLAGSVGVGALQEGTGTGADFNYPSGIALDSSGNLYIADYSNNVIREVTPSGVVTTPYGVVQQKKGVLTGISGHADGTGNNASFNTPNGIVADSSNNLYVADTGNNSIRKITAATGEVSTLATGFNAPGGIAIDSSGLLYVADSGNNVIKTVTANGTVSTLAGSGTAGYVNAAGTAAEFNNPASLTVDSQKNVYVADYNNAVIRKITPAGGVSLFAGQPNVPGYVDGPNLTAQFNAPTGIDVDGNGNLYVTDALVPSIGSIAGGNDLLRKISTTGVVSTLAGLPGSEGSSNGTGTAAQFYSLQAVAISPTTGAIYLADTYNQTIRAAGLAPVITSANSATFSLSQADSFTVTATGIPSPTFTATGLPTWASLNAQTGVLSGTPTQAGISTITITASNGFSPNATQNFTLTVGQSPIITSGNSATFAEGETNLFTVTATGNPAPTFTATGLPAWASLNAQTGALTGTPPTTGTFPISITAANGVSATSMLTINVLTPVSFSSWENTNHITNAPTATPENDGVPELLKYFYDINPTAPMSAIDRAAMPVVGINTTSVTGKQYLTLTYREYASQTGLTINVQTSTDLQTWTTVNPPDFSQQIGTDGITGDPIMETGVLMPANNTTQFIRLNVSMP